MQDCLICGEAFTPKMKSHIYCSAFCREKRKRLEYPIEQKQKYQTKYRTSEKGALNYRNYHLTRKFGLTQEQYDDLLDKQGGGCAICGKRPEAEKRSLAVDHNHITLEIRGILCSYCNRRIVGRHRDGGLLRRVADYIEQGTGLYVPAPIKKKRTRRAKRKS